MSAAKRSRVRQEDSDPLARRSTSKRLKTVNGSHVPAQPGLAFLVDEKARVGKKLEGKLTNGIRSSKTFRPDESSVVLAQASGNDAHDTGMIEDPEDRLAPFDDKSDDPEDGVDVEDESTGLPGPMGKISAPVDPLANGHASSIAGRHTTAGAVDVDMEDTNGAAVPEEMSFGELLQSRHPQPIDVASAFPSMDAGRQALVPTTRSRALNLAPGTSLGTVLTQALKTNDKDLLESCLQTHDTDTIRRTIQRLPSQHVGTLLQRLAERIHKRPGRTGSLMIWVQWSLVAHGGYLASQPGLMKQLRSLSQVMRERARGLQPLLRLKGKLDMLSAQLDLRRQMQEESRAADAADDEDEAGVLYVEGQADFWSDDDDDVDGVRQQRARDNQNDLSKRRGNTTSRSLEMEDEDQSEDDGDLENGKLHAEDDMPSLSENDEEEDELLDIDAEEGSDEEEDEDELNSADEESYDDDVDDAESSAGSDDDESVASGVQEPKLANLNRRR